MRRAVQRYDVNVIGLTLSKNQAVHVAAAFDATDSPRSRRVLLQGWEEFDEPVDRIVSIGAFEHFGYDRYDDFFQFAYGAMPADGVMLLHTIVAASSEEFQERGLKLTMPLLRFVKFIMEEIFPGAGCHRWHKCSGMRPPPASASPGFSRCDCTTRAPWTVGRRRWKPTRTRRLQSSPKRSTSAT